MSTGLHQALDWGKLAPLRLTARSIADGLYAGGHRSRRRGAGVEFGGHRSYVPGDDLRFLDWNIYARLNSLFIKLFLQEEDLHISLLVDVSKSMDIGDPSKGLYARRVAAAIAYIGLCNFDRISLYAYADGLQYELRGVRGRRLMFKVVDFLSQIQYEGTSNFTGACRQFATQHSQPGIVIMLSDFFEKGGYEAGFRYLLGRKYDLYALQILSPEEIEPTLVGDLQLKDIEDDDIADVTVSRALINRYKRNLHAYCGELKEYCGARGINYMFTDTKVPFDHIVLSYFRKRGLIK